MASKTKNFLLGSFWGLFAKVFDSFAKFISIPLLIAFYGKADFGLVALAFSLNAYLRLMELGMNIGGVRYFSVWLAKKEISKIINVSQTSILVYGIIGMVNAVIFCITGNVAGRFFHLDQAQADTFKFMMFILAASAVINWASYVVEQILMANEEFSWLSKMTILSSCLTFLWTLVVIKAGLGLTTYFFLYVSSTVLIIPLNILRLKKTGIDVVKLITPGWHVKDFREVLNYSLGIFAMGIFQFSADSLRPVLLGAYGSSGMGVLTEYRIAQTITLFVLSMGGVFFNMLIPVSSKSHAENNHERTALIVYRGTKYLSVFLSLIIFGLVVNAGYILRQYVGVQYAGIAPWLNLWLITLLLSMHTFPVSSIILSEGKTKPLVVSSAVGCVASIVLTILLAPKYNLGAAMIGYAAYVIIHNTFTYCYYIPRVLRLNAPKIFLRSFMPAACAGITSAAGAQLITSSPPFLSEHSTTVLRSLIFLGLYVTQILLFVLKPKEIRFMTKGALANA